MAGAGLAGAVISGGLQIAGSAISGKRAQKEAKRNRRFQERMSNTAYQRTMDDMRKAGLNPILAYKMGGATTPGGSMAQIPDLGKAAGTAVQAYQAQANVAQTRAATEGIGLDNQLKNFQIDKEKIIKLPYQGAGAILRNYGDAWKGAPWAQSTAKQGWWGDKPTSPGAKKVKPGKGVKRPRKLPPGHSGRNY